MKCIPERLRELGLFSLGPNRTYPFSLAEMQLGVGALVL